MYFAKNLLPMVLVGMAMHVGARGIPAAAAQQAAHEYGIRTLYAPPADGSAGGASYPRMVRLAHQPGARGHLLATFERRPHLAIYRSMDDGDSWRPLSEVEGLRWQPDLFELPRQVGDLAAGTVLLAGMQTPPDRSTTSIQLYHSADGGASWSYRSTIEEGGRMVYDAAQRAGESRETPVWEPHLYLDSRDRLVVSYATEKHKDRGYNQAIALRVSEDGGRTWGEERLVVAIGDGLARPGMPLVSRLPDGRFLMFYEIVGLPGYLLEPRTNPIYYRYSDDGIDFGDPAAWGTLVQDDRRQFISATPGLAWSPFGGPLGTLIAAGRGMMRNYRGEVGQGVMINRDGGRGYWTVLETPIEYTPGPGGYSQVMVPLGDGREVLHVVPVEGELRYTRFTLPD
jgi:hypothetical protein